jgi:hypothetical protein
MDELVHGRTETLGGHLWPCEPCGQAPDVSHACRHRRGPTCPLKALARTVARSGASGTPRSDATRGGLDHGVGGLRPADGARHSASLAVPGPGRSPASRSPTTACSPWRRARSAVASTTLSPLVGTPCPSQPRRFSAASCRTWCPKASTRAGPMRCGVPSLVPACTYSSARSQGTHPHRRRQPLHGRAICPTAGAPPRRAGQPCPHGGQGLLVVVRSLPRPPKGPPCDPRPPGGFTPASRSRPEVIRTLAPWHHAVRRSIPIPGRPLPHHPDGPGATCSPHVPRPLIPSRHTPSPPRSVQISSLSGPACIKIPSGHVQRRRSTALLCRLRATKTLIRLA